MRTSGLVLSCLLISVSLVAAPKKKGPPPPPAELRQARLLYKENNFPLALQKYRAAQQELDARRNTEDQDDPELRETVDAEIVALLHAMKEPAPFLDAAISFLQTYPGSPHGFQVSYLFALTLFELRRFEEALRVFSRHSLDTLRSLDEPARGQMLELLERIFAESHQEGPKTVMTLERRGLWRRRNGGYVLNASIADLQKRYATLEKLTAFVNTVEPEETRKALLEQLDPEALLPNVARRRGRFSGALGLALALDSFARTSYPSAQGALRPDLEFALRTTPLGDLWRLRATYDVFAYGTGGLQAQTLRVNLQYLRQVWGHADRLTWGLGTGPSYQTTWIQPVDAGVKHALFWEVFSELRIAYGEQAYGTLRLRYGPGWTPTSGFSFQNRNLAFEWESTFPTTSGASDWNYYIEIASQDLTPTLGWTRFATGIRHRWGAYTQYPPLP